MINFPQIVKILTEIPGEPFKVLWNFEIPQDFEPEGSGILQKLQLSFFKVLKFLGTQFSVIHREGGVDIFWNSPLLVTISAATRLGIGPGMVDFVVQPAKHSGTEITCLPLLWWNCSKYASLQA